CHHLPSVVRRGQDASRTSSQASKLEESVSNPAPPRRGSVSIDLRINNGKQYSSQFQFGCSKERAQQSRLCALVAERGVHMLMKVWRIPRDEVGQVAV